MTRIPILSELTLEEPLMKSAPIMSALSDFFCNGDHVDRDNCSWYHKAWQYLRILDLVSTPTWHPRFYLESLKKILMKDENINVLISGAADYSMLAYVIHACSQVGAICNIVLLDLCETPLQISKWYAAEVDFPISTEKIDILSYDRLNFFDCVVTDAFLTRFNQQDKKNVLEKWRDLLKYNGIVITTLRLDPEIRQNESENATYQEVEQFSNKAAKLAKMLHDIDVKPIEVENLAREYAKNIRSYPVRNIEETINLFNETGYIIEFCEEVKVKGEMNETTYIEVIARKR